MARITIPNERLKMNLADESKRYIFKTVMRRGTLHRSALILSCLAMGACSDPNSGSEGSTGAESSTGPDSSPSEGGSTTGEGSTSGSDSSGSDSSGSDSSGSSETGGTPAELVPGNHAIYWTASDGVEIALDVWVPDAPGPAPTVMQMTRYWRAVEALPDAPTVDRWRDLAQTLSAQGFAVVLVDARGSGASFGQRPSPWSPREQQDYAEIGAWLAEQPWSTGNHVAWGISYDGTAAEHLAASGNAGMRGVGALFSDYDPYLSIARPGGILQESFVAAWSENNDALDSGDACAYPVELSCKELMATIAGVKPADEDDDRSLLAMAQAEHGGNVDVFDALAGGLYRDSEFHPDVGSLSDVSPHAAVVAAGETGVPFYAVASWLDAGTASSALTRFAQNPSSQVLRIGPYSHAGFFSVDPFMPFDPAAEPPINMLIGEMFDTLAPSVFGAPLTERSIEYYVLGEGSWESTDTWPPAGVEEETWFFSGGGALTSDLPLSDATTPYAVDFTATTGEFNRWQTQLDGAPVLYGDRALEDEKLLTFTSDPVEAGVRIVGQPRVQLFVETSVEDAAFYGYLEVVDPDGVVTYATEGQLRGMHRAVAEAPIGQGPLHSFLSGDAQPLDTDGFNDVEFVMQPVAVAVPAGHRIRVALAGHDAGSFERIPADGSVEWLVGQGPSTPSGVVLPIVSQ